MDKRMNTKDAEAWQDLANAIVEQAIADYRRWQHQLENNALVDRIYQMRLVSALERLRDFFCGDWFPVLTDVDGYDLLCRLDEEAQ